MPGPGPRPSPVVRKAAYITAKRSWRQRNPRLFTSLFVGGSLLVLFSRPLYDGFIRDIPPAPAPK